MAEKSGEGHKEPQTYADFAALIEEGRTSDVVSLLEKFGFCDPAKTGTTEVVGWSWAALELLRQLLVCAANGLGSSKIDWPSVLLPRVAKSVDLKSFVEQLEMSMRSNDLYFRSDAALDENFLKTLSAADGQPQENTIREIENLDMYKTMALLDYILQHHEPAVNDGYNAAILGAVLNRCGVDKFIFFFTMACSLVVPSEVVENLKAKVLLSSISDASDANPAGVATFLVSMKMAEEALRGTVESRAGDGKRDVRGGDICTGRCDICQQKDCPNRKG